MPTAREMGSQRFRGFIAKAVWRLSTRQAASFIKESVPSIALGCIHIYEWSATGANFSHFEKRGATHTGCLLATSDKEMGKNGPVPSGCGVNWAILRCRPRPRSHQSLRPPPCLAQFTLATLTTRICGYTLGFTCGRHAGAGVRGRVRFLSGPARGRGA